MATVSEREKAFKFYNLLSKWHVGIISIFAEKKIFFWAYEKNVYLATPHYMWNFSFQTRDWAQILCIGSTES